MITVHHLDNSRSQRTLWLLEELGLDYRVERYRRDPQTMLAPPELRRIHPLGKSPILVDDDLTVAESGAIIEYLLDRYDAKQSAGALRPATGTPGRMRFTYWLHYAEGSAMPPLLLKLVFLRIPHAPMPFFVKPVARGISDKVQSQFVDPQIALHFDFMEDELAKTGWFAGAAFSAADIQMSFPIEAGSARGLLAGNRPRLSAWLDRIHARPAYARALEKGGPYELLR
jgi:glutathione S-transferase